MDMRLQKGVKTSLPEPPESDVAFLFYVFDGKIELDDGVSLKSGDSILIKQEAPSFYARETSDIVLFITQTTSIHFDNGMYSGNIKNK